MQIHFAIPPNSAFHGLLEEFFFSISKLQNIYHIVNQFVRKISIFPDTPYIEDKVVEYRYKLLRDTIRIHKADSIPVVRTVVETKEVRYVPPWIKALAWIGALCILLLIGVIILKLTIRYFG